MWKHIKEPLDTSPLQGKVPGYVIAIIEKCMKKDPAERYSSAADLQRALEAAIANIETSESDTIVQAAPRPGQLLLLHVEHQEASLPGAYREYEVTARISEGSFGEVYRAKERLSGQDVALKILKHEWLANEETVKRFRREAALLAGLSHPNVVRLINFGRYGQTFFLAMELLAGTTLDRLRRERGTLPPDEAVRYARGILSGLAAVHEAGIVHRDLKPANVQLTGDRAVIFDFGLAHAQDLSRMTMTGTFLGTVAYAAPEQVAALPVSGKTDVYALGVVLYELLTGRLPHEADSLVGLQHKKASEPPTPITAHRRDLPADIVGTLNRMLETDPDLRPTAAEARKMLDALRPAAG
jgi:serine/threonine-protein kinase